MNDDVVVTKSTTTEVVHVEGMTEAGVEFVDSFTSTEMSVVDSGVLLLPEAVLPQFIERSKQAGLLVAEIEL